MRSLALFLVTAAAFAQNNATVTGTVLNLPGEKVPNAPIQLTNAATKQTYKARARRKEPTRWPCLPARMRFP